MDTLRIDKHTFQHDPDDPGNDSVNIQGAISVVDTSVDLENQMVVVSYGDFSLEIPVGGFQRKGKKASFNYNSQKAHGASDVTATVSFDFEKATFKISINHADIGESAPADLAVMFGTFDQMVSISSKS